MLRQSALSLVLLLTLGLSTAVCQEGPSIMFILDSSGSMTQDAGGLPKIEAAKKVMHELVSDLDESILVGLTAYGHRGKGDCNDIEILVPPGSSDRSALLAHVDRLQARGKTPLTKTVLQVAGMLKTNDDSTTIVLVSDGIDTCGGDPCAIVRQLKAAGIKFVLHVVGFDVNSAARDQLNCMAGAGDGRYFDATDANSLVEALRTVTVEVAAKFEQAQLNVKPETSPLGKLRVTMPKGSESSIAFIELTKADNGKVIKLAKDPSDTSTHPLLKGEYSVRLGFNQANYGQPTITDLGNVTIRGGATRDLNLGSVSFNVPEELLDGERPNRISIDKLMIVDAGSGLPAATVLDNKNGYYNFKPKPLIAGIYDILVKYRTNTEGLTKIASAVRVTKGKDTVVTLNTGIQVESSESLIGFQLVPVASQAADAAEDGDAKHEPQPILSTRAYSSVSGGPDNLKYPYVVPAGTYRLLVDIEGMTDLLPISESLTIEEGQFLKFDTGL